MSFYENVSELARELRTAAGTVLSIVGSRLEAEERARVDEVGPQWLTEFEEQRDHLEPGECTCEPCPLRDEDVCDEAEADEDEPSPLADDHTAMMLGLVPDGRTPEERLSDALATNGESMKYRYCGSVSPEGDTCERTDQHDTHTRLLPCGCTATWVADHPDSSAAVSAAADPSPATTTGCSRAGDEGPEGASAIPPAAPSGQPTSEPLCDVMDFRETHLPLRCTLDADHSGDHVAHGWGGQTWATWPQSMRADPESDPGVVTSPAPGEVLEDDLAAHIMGDFVSGQDVDPLTATLIDALSSRIASALLTDFTITRRA